MTVSDEGGAYRASQKRRDDAGDVAPAVSALGIAVELAAQLAFVALSIASAIAIVYGT